MKKLLFSLFLLLTTFSFSQNSLSKCLVTIYKNDTLNITDINDQFVFIYVKTTKISDSDLKELISNGWIISSKTQELYKLVMIKEEQILGGGNILKFSIYENK